MSLSLPTLSVIMPVFNAAAFLRESIESILHQTFSDFEFLIFDDGSSDETPSIIASYPDKRIRSFRSEINRGYTTHLNQGLRLARGEFCARMDADDISLLERFEKQIGFLKNHPDIGICGTDVSCFGAVSCLHWSYPSDHSGIVFQAVFDSPFAHPTVMLRTDFVRQFELRYDENLVPAEDYDLWVRMLAFTQGANLGEPLLRYRIHDQSISRQKNQTQAKHAVHARLKHLKNLFSDSFSLEDLATISAFIGHQKAPQTNSDLKLTERFFRIFSRLVRCSNSRYAPKLQSMIASLFSCVLFQKLFLNVWALKRLCKSVLIEGSRPPLHRILHHFFFPLSFSARAFLFSLGIKAVR